MTKKPCIDCGITKPATKDYFHRDRKMRDGLRNDCKACANMARFKRKLRARLATGEPTHRTPRVWKQTPDYIAFERRKWVIYQRIARARKIGRLDTIPRLQMWLTQIKQEWYQGIVARGG